MYSMCSRSQKRKHIVYRNSGFLDKNFNSQMASRAQLFLTIMEESVLWPNLAVSEYMSLLRARPGFYKGFVA